MIELLYRDGIFPFTVRLMQQSFNCTFQSFIIYQTILSQYVQQKGLNETFMEPALHAKM